VSFFVKLNPRIVFIKYYINKQMSDNKPNNSKPTIEPDYNALLSRLKKREADRVKIVKEFKMLFSNTK